MSSSSSRLVLSFVRLAVKIFWSFDNNLDDLYNNFPGVTVNGSSFAANGINGYGSCLYLNRSASQSVVIYSPPFLNMAQTSFSLQAWIYGTSFYDSVNGSIGDNAIFGQHQNYATDQSLHIIVRDRKIYLGFYDDDTQGNQLLSPGVWYHVSAVISSRPESMVRVMPSCRCHTFMITPHSLNSCTSTAFSMYRRPRKGPIKGQAVI